MKSILSLGAVYLDINAYHFPIPEDSYMIGKEILGEEYETVLGGSAVNFARFCAKLDLSTYFIGKTGQDKIRDILLTLFEKENIKTLLKSSSDVKTNMNVNLVDNNARSIMLHMGTANQSISRGDVFDEIIKVMDDIDTLYVGGIFKLKSLLPIYTELINLLKPQNKKIILDHGRITNGVNEKERAMVRKLVEKVDIYLPSKDEFLELWNVTSIREGLALFKDKPLTIVVKDGDNGAHTLTDGRMATISAFPVIPINTIGAGDAFNAGLIISLSKGEPLEKAIRFANATAAIKISSNMFPGVKEVEKFLLHNK